MQPYLFPYLGYFQLVAAADRFVFFDDVTFIRRGWINRNRWLLDGRVGYFTVPLQHASCFRTILEIPVVEPGRWRRKLLESLHQHYRRARHYNAVAPLFESVLSGGGTSIADLARASICACAAYLDLDTVFVASSAVYDNAELRGSQRVLDICLREAATEYLNLPAGRALYDARDFEPHGIRLRFIEPTTFVYEQGSGAFAPNLSIIDVLMHCERDQVREVLAARVRSG